MLCTVVVKHSLNNRILSVIHPTERKQKLKRYSNNTVTVNSLGHDNHVASYSDSSKYDTRAQKTKK